MSNHPLNRNKKSKYHRHRTLARSLNERVFLTREGRLFLVGGKPKFEQLRTALTRIRDSTSVESSPTPKELGFSVDCDGELTEYGLAVRDQALASWERAIHELLKQSNTRRRNEQLVREVIEVKRLRTRLAELSQIRVNLASFAQSPGDSYVLNREEEVELATLLRRRGDKARFSQTVELTARIVFWITGSQGVNRFLDAMGLDSCEPSNLQRIDQLFRFRQRLYGMKHCSQNGETIAIDGIASEFTALPEAMIFEACAAPKLTGKPLISYLDYLITRCTKFLELLRAEIIIRIPGNLAALCICDGGDAQLPMQLLERITVEPTPGTFRDIIDALHEESDKPGYNEFLAAVDEFDTVLSPDEFKLARALLKARVPLTVIKWAHERNLLRWFKGPTPQPIQIKEFVASLERCGIELSDDEVIQILKRVTKSKVMRAIELWVTWLQLLTPATVTPKLRKLLIKSLHEHVIPLALILRKQKRLHDLFEPNSADYPDIGSAEAYPELSEWLQRIAFYRQVSQMPVSIPKSLRMHLERAARLQKEAAHLRGLYQQGIANESQTARLEYLTRSDSSPRRSTHRLLRDAQTVCVITAIEALRAVLIDEAAARWHSLSGFRLDSTVSAQAVEMVGWVERMAAPERRLLTLILRARKEHGKMYKTFLPGNQEWIARACARGASLAPWFTPAEWKTRIMNREVTISISHEPYRTFLMGQFFDTCLRFGGENEMSLLANAHDANKQVVYMVDENGTVLARQLVAINESFRLMGYHCYCVAAGNEQQTRDQIIGGMAMFCGRWARRCGLELDDVGEPQSISDHFWYDDGVWAWHQIGKQSWAAELLPQMA